MTPGDRAERVSELIQSEASRRHHMWEALRSHSEAGAIAPQALSEIGVRPHRTVQGIFRDKDQTAAVAPPHGVTLSLLFTGQTYDDTFDEDSGLYHYPDTRRQGRDEAEIEATRNAMRCRLPLFVILRGPKAGLRKVRRGWVEDWDDTSRMFLLAFSEPGPEVTPDRRESVEFRLRVENRPQVATMRPHRPGQARFRFAVFKRYGPQCAVCNLSIPVLLEAVHLCSFADGGADDVRNALVLCRNHHRALDERLFAIEPETGRITCRSGGPTAEELSITAERLATVPHREALGWCWELFCQEAENATPRVGGRCVRLHG